MNRVIKFRAWDIEAKKMRYDVTEIEFDCEAVANGVAVDGDYLSIRDKKANLMQYTGIEDTNGVEIYEGDIVRVEEHWSSREKLTQEVRYVGSAFLPFSNGDWSWSGDDCEVIGNIYENKELL